MSERGERQRWFGRAVSRAVAAVAFLPLLYVASMGPASRAVEQGHLSYDRLQAVYDPLIAIAGRPGWPGKLLVRYATFCDGGTALQLVSMRQQFLRQSRQNEELRRQGKPVFIFESREVTPTELR